VQKTLQAYIADKKKQNFLIYGLGQAFNLVTPVIVVPHIVKVCGEEGLGKIGYGFALALFLILVVDYSFEIKGTKEVSENRHDPKLLARIFNTTLFSKLMLFAAVAAIAFLLITTIPFFNREGKLFGFSMAIVLAQVFNPIWYLQGLENYKAVSLINIFSKSLYLILIYLLINNHNDYVLVNLLLGLSALLFNLGGLIYLLTRHGIKVILPPVGQIMDILKADFTFCVSQLFLSARQLSPLVLTGYFLGDFAAGQYKLIEQVITLFRTFIQVFLRYFYPLACYKAQEGMVYGFNFWKRYSAVNLLLVSAGAVFLSFFPEEILGFFNASQQTIRELSGLFRLALIIPVLMACSLPMEQLMFIMGRNKIYVRIAIFVTAVNIVAILILVKDYLVPGVIISLVVAEILFIILYFKNSCLHLSRKTEQ